MFDIWDAIFLLMLVNLAYTILWYEHSKNGLGYPKSNVGKLYSLECLSWNNLKSLKFSSGETIIGLDLSSIICLGFSMFWIIVLPQLFSGIPSNMSYLLTLNSFSNF